MSAGDGERSTAGPGDGEKGTAGPGRGSAWRAAVFAAAGSLVLHGAAVLWVWHSGGFGRVGVIAWIDFPSSLAYLRPRGGIKLAWSLLLGGLQWAALGAGLSLLFGRAARRPGA
ncbi:MAG TPA: hypothetical protein VHB47_09600 [Thermoanaerobaculia bacterium]|nr:hypothetical protein [Thermoanaerobaculia bacterium]